MSRTMIHAFLDDFVKELEKVHAMVERWILIQHKADGVQADQLFSETERFCLKLKSLQAASTVYLSEDVCYQIFDMAMSSAAIAVIMNLRSNMSAQARQEAIERFQTDFQMAQEPTPAYIDANLWKTWVDAFRGQADAAAKKALGVGSEQALAGGAASTLLCNRQVQSMEQFQEWRSQHPGVRIAHVKGFGNGLGDHYLDDALAEIEDFDAVAWDGDPYAEDGFTELVARFLRARPSRRAVAFKLGDAEKVIEKVGAKWDPLDLWPQIAMVAVDKDAENSKLADEVEKLPESLPGWAKDFFVLGRAAILATGSKRAVCLGGGGITGWEAQASMGQGVTWTVFAASRGKQEAHATVVDWAVKNESSEFLKIVRGKDPNEPHSMAGQFP